MNSTASYLEVRITCPEVPEREILSAWLFECGFDSFEEVEDELLGYIESESFEKNKVAIEEQLGSRSWQVKEVESQNWNEAWESNFEPITIADQLYIRASFHEPIPKFKLEIVIDPKMSFGTGHHQTTSLCAHTLLEMDLHEKSVLDMGSGTGILAILAAKLGANELLAIDNDEWAYKNSLENLSRNNCDLIKSVLGDKTALPENRLFDFFIANINRNVLLEDLPAYAECIKVGGHLLLSGFYSEDVPMLVEKAASLGFQEMSKKTMDNWCAVLFVKG